MRSRFRNLLVQSALALRLSFHHTFRALLDGGGGKTCSPATAIRPRLHQLISAFISLLMPSSQPYLNASRRASPRCCCRCGGEESSPLQSQSDEDALLFSASLSLPQSRSTPTTSSSSSLSRHRQITIAQLPRPCNKHQCRRGCRHLHKYAVNAGRN